MRSFYMLFMVGLLASCTAGYQSSQASFGEDAPAAFVGQKAKAAERSEPVSYRIYLDNSYSMNGYFNGSTRFLSTVNRLVTETSNYADDGKTTCNLYHINNGINFYGSTKSARIDMFLSKINNFYGAGQKGNRGVTDLKDVLNTIIDSVRRDAVSIVITDAIPSPGLKGQEAETYLDILQNSLYKAVYSKLAECDFATVIIKCNSDFDGTYINQLNKGVKYAGKSRPYYMLVMGNEAGAQRVAGLVKSSIKSANYEGCYTLSNTRRLKVRSKVLVGTDYDLVGTASSLKIKKHREAGENMTVRMLLNMKGLPVSDAYLADAANYVVNPTGAKLTITKLENSDDPANKGFTHKLVIVTNKIAPEQDIKVSLKYDMPAWIYNSNTEQDIVITEGFEDKTYGLMYVVNGLQEGYKGRQIIDNYFSLNVQVN